MSSFGTQGIILSKFVSAKMKMERTQENTRTKQKQKIHGHSFEALKTINDKGDRMSI